MKRNHCFHLSKNYIHIYVDTESVPTSIFRFSDQTCHLGAYRTVTDGLAIVRRGEKWVSGKNDNNNITMII